MLLASKENSILQQDLEQIANLSILSQLNNETVMVTGATGLIGSQLIKSLLYHNYLYNKKIKVIALVRDKNKAETVFRSVLPNEELCFYVHDIQEPISLEEKVDYIIHCASATSSRYFVEKPVETIQTTLKGTKNILDFSRCQNVKKVVYLSSLEVYGIPYEDKTLSETDYGYIDPLQTRSSYSEGKRMAECLCVSYASEYLVPVTIARLSQTFGAGVSYNDSRVFAEFARCVIEKRDIILHTEGRTVRSYCYTADAVHAILLLMLKGVPGEAYNVTNMDTAISIRQMADLVSSLSPDHSTAVKIEIPDNVSVFGYNPEMIIRLDNTKLQNLGWNATIGITEMFQRLINSMKEG